MTLSRFHLRRALPADIPALFKVRTSVRENHLSMEALAQLNITFETLPSLLAGAGRGWVIECNRKIVAFAMANATEKTIFALFVLPDYEGRGLGRLLMKQAEQWLWSQGCQAIWLLTDRNPQVRANGFYRQLGWQDDGVQANGQVRFIKQLSSGTERFEAPSGDQRECAE